MPAMERIRRPLRRTREVFSRTSGNCNTSAGKVCRPDLSFAADPNLTWQGLRRNMIPVQAAALTFYR